MDYVEVLKGIAETAGNLSALALSLFVLVMFFRGQIVPKAVVTSMIVDTVAEIERRRADSRATEVELELARMRALVTGVVTDSENRIKEHVTGELNDRIGRRYDGRPTR